MPHGIISSVAAWFFIKFSSFHESWTFLLLTKHPSDHVLGRISLTGRRVISEFEKKSNDFANLWGFGTVETLVRSTFWTILRGALICLFLSADFATGCLENAEFLECVKVPSMLAYKLCLESSARSSFGAGNFLVAILRSAIGSPLQYETSLSNFLSTPLSPVEWSFSSGSSSFGKFSEVLIVLSAWNSFSDETDSSGAFLPWVEEWEWRFLNRGKVVNHVLYEGLYTDPNKTDQTRRDRKF